MSELQRRTPGFQRNHRPRSRPTNGAQTTPAAALSPSEFVRNWSADGVTLLSTLMATYFPHADRPIPSALLVDLLREFRITEANSRSIISRSLARGWLTQSRSGRATYYQLTDPACAEHQRRLHRFVDAPLTSPEWDGTWIMVLFTVVETDRARRHQLRTALTRRHFARLYDGVWVRPSPIEDDAVATLAIIAPQSLTIVTGAIIDHLSGQGDPTVAFALRDLGVRYRRFVDSNRAIAGRVLAGSFDPTSALTERSRVLHEWLQLAEADPRLPSELLDEDWPAHGARNLFLTIYLGLEEAAALRVRTLSADFHAAGDTSSASTRSARVLPSTSPENEEDPHS